MRLLSNKFSPSMNMAVDEVLLDSNALRFYTWDGLGLSVGRFQDINDIDLDFCKKNSISVVRRITGGKAVLHSNELTYSIVLDEKDVPSSVVESYRVICTPILRALRNLGFSVSFREEKASGSSSVCFNDPSWYEIVLDGKKVVGSAQVRKNGKVLQHGSILLGVDFDLLDGCFKGVDRSKIGFLDVDVGKLRSELVLEFRKEFDLTEDELSEEEMKRAKLLMKQYILE